MLRKNPTAVAESSDAGIYYTDNMLLYSRCKIFCDCKRMKRLCVCYLFLFVSWSHGSIHAPSILVTDVIEVTDYSILKMISTGSEPPLIARPIHWINRHVETLALAETLANFDNHDSRVKAANMYLMLLRGLVSADIYKNHDVTIIPFL